MYRAPQTGPTLPGVTVVRFMVLLRAVQAIGECLRWHSGRCWVRMLRVRCTRLLCLSQRDLPPLIQHQDDDDKGGNEGAD